MSDAKDDIKTSQETKNGAGVKEGRKKRKRTSTLVPVETLYETTIATDDDISIPHFHEALRLAFDVDPELHELFTDLDLLYPNEVPCGDFPINYMQLLQCPAGSAMDTTQRDPVDAILHAIFANEDVAYGDKIFEDDYEMDVWKENLCKVLNRYATYDDFIQHARDVMKIKTFEEPSDKWDFDVLRGRYGLKKSKVDKASTAL